jgi:protein arginine kinase activator
MLCESCTKNLATVHLTDVAAWHGMNDERNEVQQKHLCEPCSQHQGLPFTPSPSKVAANLWGLINLKAKQAGTANTSPKRTITCSGCGHTLEDFRRRGRLGCSDCYETFGTQLADMLERMHGAIKHVGRIPGVDLVDVERREQISSLELALEDAVRDEAYERAANLRDELKSLTGTDGELA